MEHKIKEEGILEIKALTVSRGIFKQTLQMDQKAFLKHCGETGMNPWDTGAWTGFAVDRDLQTEWFILEADGTLKRVRDIELFWATRSENHPQPVEELRGKLRQIFLK